MAFQLPFIDLLAKSFSDELPQNLGNMDSHVDYILKHIKPYGEDLRESKFWHNKRWKEIRDDANFHEAILHIFMPEEEYLLTVDGNVMTGAWRQIGGNNSIILEMGGRKELFDLAFLNDDFLILKKHGEQTRKNLRKYFVLVKEGTAKTIDWRNLMELLYNIYRYDSNRYASWFLLVIVIVAIFLILSLG